MKSVRNLVVAILAGTLVWSCQSGPSQAEKDYETISAQMDSIRQVNDELKTRQQELMDKHQQLMASADTMQNVDSTKLASLARHQVMYEEQKASFGKIDDILQSETDFRTKHEEGNLTDQEIQAQVDEMKESQRDIINEQDEIRRELDQMANDHEGFMTRNTNKGMDGLDQTKTGRTN